MTLILWIAVLLLAGLAITTHRAYHRVQTSVLCLEASLAARTAIDVAARKKATAPIRHLHPLALSLVRELEPLATWPPDLATVPAPFLLVHEDLVRLAEAAEPCGPNLRLHAAAALDSLAHVLTLLQRPRLPAEPAPLTPDPRQLIELRVHAQYAHRDAMCLLSALERADSALGYSTAG
jgi:hypothetical protein